MLVEPKVKLSNAVGKLLAPPMRSLAPFETEKAVVRPPLWPVAVKVARSMVPVRTWMLPALAEPSMAVTFCARVTVTPALGLTIRLRNCGAAVPLIVCVPVVPTNFTFPPVSELNVPLSTRLPPSCRLAPTVLLVPLTVSVPPTVTFPVTASVPTVLVPVPLRTSVPPLFTVTLPVTVTVPPVMVRLPPLFTVMLAAEFAIVAVTTGSQPTLPITMSLPTAGTPLGLQLAEVVQAVSEELQPPDELPPSQVFVACATYGPTTGPPPPGTPAGVTPAVESSVIERARLIRPLPATPDAGSASRAMRPTMVSLDAPWSAARRRAADPATIAAEAEVPETEVVPVASDAAMSTPGAVTKTAALVLENEATASFWSVAPTPTTLARPAG